MTTHPILGQVASVESLGRAVLEAINANSGCSIPQVLADINARALELPVQDVRADLLEALTLLLREVDESIIASANDYGWPVAVQKSRAAIAKATGATP